MLYLKSIYKGVFRAQKSKKKFFTKKIVNGFQLLTIFAKGTIFDFRLGSEYASDLLFQNQQ